MKTLLKAIKRYFKLKFLLSDLYCYADKELSHVWQKGDKYALVSPGADRPYTEWFTLLEWEWEIKRIEAIRELAILQDAPESKP